MNLPKWYLKNLNGLKKYCLSNGANRKSKDNSADTSGIVEKLPYISPKTPVSETPFIIPSGLVQTQTDGGKYMEAVVHHVLAG